MEHLLNKMPEPGSCSSSSSTATTSSVSRPHTVTTHNVPDSISRNVSETITTRKMSDSVTTRNVPDPTSRNVSESITTHKMSDSFTTPSLFDSTSRKVSESITTRKVSDSLTTDKVSETYPKTISPSRAENRFNTKSQDSRYTATHKYLESHASSSHKSSVRTSNKSDVAASERNGRTSEMRSCSKSSVAAHSPPSRDGNGTLPSQTGKSSQPGILKPSSLDRMKLTAESSHKSVQMQRQLSGPAASEDEDGSTPTMLATGSSIMSSASAAWATPSELFSKLSPKHRLMLEKAKVADNQDIQASAPEKNYYKLNLDFLDSPDHKLAERPPQTNSEPFTKSKVRNYDERHPASEKEKTNKYLSKVKQGETCDLHTASSLVDVRGSTGDGHASLTNSNLEDFLNSSKNVKHAHKALSSAEFKQLASRRKAVVSRKHMEYLGSPPSKSQSLPNVADTDDLQNKQESHDKQEIRDKQESRDKQERHDKESNARRLDKAQMAQSEYRESREQGTSSQPTYHSLPFYLLSPSNTGSSAGKREGYRVSFKNIDSDSSIASDNESASSVVSSSSVASFRDALKSRRHARKSGHRPIQVTPVAEDKVKPLPRPIALVTRQTQVPSPLLVKNK